MPDITSLWAGLVTKSEGYFPGSRSYRNNNPGNLKVPGDLGVDSSGFGIFSTPEAGMQALQQDLNAKIYKYPNASISDITQRYVGNDINYGDTVASGLGLDPSTLLKDLPSLDPLGGTSPAGIIGDMIPGAKGIKAVVSGGLATLSVTNIITIIVGIVFLLGAVLSFDKTREVAVSAAKTIAA